MKNNKISINNFNEIINKKLEKIKNNENTNKSNKINYTSFEKLLLIVIVALFFSIAGFFIGNMKNNNNGNYFTNNQEINHFLQEYNYIIDNYYEEVDKNKLISGAINGMLSTLDGYSSFMGKENNSLNINLKGSYKGLGIGLIKDYNGNNIVTSVYDNSPAIKAGIMVNDIIKKVNGEEVDNLESEQIVEKMNQKDTVTLEILREKQNITVDLKKDNIIIKSVFSKLIDNKIGYIKLNIFAENTDEQFKEELDKLENSNIRGLIIDLRNNSGGHLTTAENILSLFLSNEHVIYQTQDRKQTNKVFSTGLKDKKYKIVILQNGNSASASEIIASALNEQLNAYIIGEKSFGKGTVQEIQNINDIGKYKLTTKKWLTSNGIWINKKGIEPNLKIKLSDNFYNNPIIENDNQIKEAINYLNK